MMTNIETFKKFNKDGRFNWEAAEEYYGNEDEVIEAMHRFYDGMTELCGLYDESEHQQPKQATTLSHYEQDKMSLYEYDGHTGYYDSDGCWCIDYRK